MDRLEDIPTEDLWQLLDEMDGSVPTQRVLAAIAAKQGDSTSRLAERHNVSQQTIRNWLDRFETRPLDEAPFDEPRAGRPRKLSEEEHAQLIEELHDSPEAAGFDRQAWFPRLVYHHLKSEYGVEYSLRHIRRLMREADLTWRTARPTHYEGDPEEAEEFQETVKKTDSP
ncbi:MAG: IS630 family transposase [Halobacteriaceae archaeon]